MSDRLTLRNKNITFASLLEILSPLYYRTKTQDIDCTAVHHHDPDYLGLSVACAHQDLVASGGVLQVIQDVGLTRLHLPETPQTGVHS